MEKDLKFSSAVCTSRVQSERLLALGLKKETADCVWLEINNGDWKINANGWKEFYSNIEDRILPAWSLHRLIEMTKLKVTPFLYGVEISHPQWERAFVKRANVWDNLCDCIEWLIKEGYFNKEYLEV